MTLLASPKNPRNVRLTVAFCKASQRFLTLLWGEARNADRHRQSCGT
jgi:hypothetical protein